MPAVNKYFFLTAFLICCHTFSMAQEADTSDDTEPAIATEYTGTVPARPVVYNSQQPTGAQWNKIINDKDFWYKDKIEYTPQPPGKTPKQPDLRWLDRIVLFFRFFTTVLGHAILLGLLIAIVGYVLYRIVSGEGKGLFVKNSKKQITPDEEQVSEEDLLASNWESKLQKALHIGDKRLAVRYSYMLVLQLLQHRNLISYRHDKTNIEYYRELVDEDTKNAFRRMMRQYEYSWYGNYPPSQPSFDEYFGIFKHLKNKLNVQ